MASLYKGDELADPATMVVAKVFHQATNDPQRFRTFLREVRGMHLHHPHIGQIIDSGQIADRNASSTEQSACTATIPLAWWICGPNASAPTALLPSLEDGGRGPALGGVDLVQVIGTDTRPSASISAETTPVAEPPSRAESPPLAPAMTVADHL